MRPGWAALTALTCAALISACSSHAVNRVAAGQKAASITDLRDLRQFQKLFNRDHGLARLVLFLSPT